MKYKWAFANEQCMIGLQNKIETNAKKIREKTRIVQGKKSP